MLPIAYELCWNAANNCVGCHVFSDDGASGDDSTTTNVHAR